MRRDELWQNRVREAADQVLGPLISDGGVFRYDSLDYESRSLAMSYSLDVCEACVISTEDLAAMLDEGIERATGSAVTVALTELPATQ